MAYENVCKFVPAENEPAEIRPVRFVLETAGGQEREEIRSVYALHLVTTGTGRFLCDRAEYEIEKGDAFFTVPSSLFAVQSAGGLEYAYVSFIGLGAPALLKRVAPGRIFKGNEGLIGFWLDALGRAEPQNIDLLARSVLDYSAAALVRPASDETPTDTLVGLERYVRAHFSDCGLSLRSLSKTFGYDEKYLSKLFLRTTGIRFGDYLTELRISAACAALRAGKTAVKQIALSCGFSDPLYFSKVFKKKTGVPPSLFGKQ